jgi:co-chaperonin GroES (HSP10)
MQAFGNNIIITRIAPTKTTESGIILQSVETPDYGKVDSVGKSVKEVQVGDTVMLNWNKAQQIVDETFAVPISEVIAIVE